MKRGMTLLEVVAALALLGLIVVATLPLTRAVRREAKQPASPTPPLVESEWTAELAGRAVGGHRVTDGQSTWVEWDLDAWTDEAQ